MPNFTKRVCGLAVCLGGVENDRIFSPGYQGIFMSGEPACFTA